MSNKYWLVRNGVTDWSITYCELTKKPCVGHSFCSQCPIEYRGATYEEAMKIHNE